MTVIFAPARRFDDYLAGVRSDDLKSMVRMWGGKSQMRKDECIATICNGLRDPQQVQAALGRLERFEKTALALVRWMGGQIEAGALAVGIRASGVQLPPRFHDSRWNDSGALLRSLLQHGVILNPRSNDPVYLPSYYYSYDASQVFSDDRLLAYAGELEPQPLEIKSAPSPAATIYRRPPAVMLDMISILQAIENLGGIGLTQKGELRANDERRFRRGMGWKDDGLQIDGFEFPEPARAWIYTIYHAGMLLLQGNQLVLKEPVTAFAGRTYAEQVRTLLKGLLRTMEWKEIATQRWYNDDRYYPQGRLALILALMSIPEAEDFIRIDDLDQALFERIGEHFSLTSTPGRPFTLSRDLQTIQKAAAEWRAKLRKDWLKQERPWIEQTLTTWLYALGMVELGLDEGRPASLRLTELGRAVLHPHLAEKMADPVLKTRTAGNAWIVQPNFDIVTYLDRTTPAQLTFLERHAERVQAQQHTAQYRLTRNSVYLGLESGTTLEELLDGLQGGSNAELPQNVVTEIKEWASLREQISLYRHAHLLEFDSKRACQAALDKGLPGRLVGERFLKLSSAWLQEASQARPAKADRVLPATQIDYAAPLPKCLSVNEDGIIKVEDAPDMLIGAQLAKWAEAQADKKWRLTQASVSAAITNGIRIESLFRLLAERLPRPLPAFLQIALNAWAGEALQVELAPITVLRCRRGDIFQAILTSKKLKPYLLGTLAPDILVVDQEQVEAFKAQLAWAGLKISDQLVVETPRYRKHGR
jgi:hypothetical protein